MQIPVIIDTSIFFEIYAARAVITEAIIYLLLKEISILPFRIKIAGTINEVNTAGAIKLMYFVNLGGISRFPEIIISGKRVQYVASPALFSSCWIRVLNRVIWMLPVKNVLG